MLGLADKLKLLRLLSFIFQGDQKKSLESLSIENDLLEIKLYLGE